MRINVYKNISKIASRIRTEILNQYSPGDRIPSEIEIADLLQESQNKIHRALQMLIEEGIIYSSGGRRGMYFTPLLSGTSKRRSKEVRLKFSIPNVVNVIQYRLWKRITEMFHMIEPSVEIELVRNPNLASEINADCYLHWLPLLDCSPFRPLDLSRIPEVGNMVKDIEKTGIQYKKQYGLPILHAPGVFWAHRNMLKKCGLNKETFTEPYDCFRWGDILQSNGLCAHGFSFWGFIYHAANWGIALQREGNEFLIDRKKLKKFFSSCSEYLNHYTILNASNYMGILFHRGQQGLMAGFLNTFPQNEKRFEFLGQPLVKDGFSSQALFLVSMGKNTEYEDIVYDFFRFILMDHIQELFLSPEVNFSVIERIYRVQYKKISEMTCVNIPAFDLRGIYPMMDLDFLAFTQRYVHAETVEALLDFKNHDKVIESICRINIPERRRIFLETASQSFLKQYDPYIKYLKDSGEI